MADVRYEKETTGLVLIDPYNDFYRPGDDETWKYIAPIQRAAWSRKTFEYGTWAASYAVGSSLSRVMLWHSNIGAPAVSQTPLSTSTFRTTRQSW
jgi:hypothetical protein